MVIVKTHKIVGNKDDSETFDYKCDWCSFEFTRRVRKGVGQGGVSKVSDQVKCGRCGNFIKTWS